MIQSFLLRLQLNMQCHLLIWTPQETPAVGELALHLCTDKQIFPTHFSEKT